MSEPARNLSSIESAGRPSTTSGPLRDWLAAMRATAPEGRQETRQAAPARVTEPAPPAPTAAESKGWAPRLVVAGEETPESVEDASEVIAENMMLRAKLRLEADRRDELQLLLAQEIRELRTHVAEEMTKIEDVRAERDLWKARCEALMSPLFTPAPGR